MIVVPLATSSLRQWSWHESSDIMAFCTRSSALAFMRSSHFVDFSCRAWPCCSVAIAALGLALVLCKGRCSGQRMLIRTPRDWYHRHTRDFNGTPGSCVAATSLACDHRTRALRRESFCFFYFKERRREAGNLACSGLHVQKADRIVCVTAGVLPNRQRFNRRESNR